MNIKKKVFWYVAKVLDLLRFIYLFIYFLVNNLLRFIGKGVLDRFLPRINGGNILGLISSSLFLQLKDPVSISLRIHDPTSKPPLSRENYCITQWNSRHYRRPKPSIFPPILWRNRRFPFRYFYGRSPSRAKPIAVENPYKPWVKTTVVASQRRSRRREIEYLIVWEMTRVGFTLWVLEVVGCLRWPCLHSNRWSLIAAPYVCFLRKWCKMIENERKQTTLIEVLLCCWVNKW